MSPHQRNMSVFISTVTWKCSTLYVFFDVAKFTTVTPLSLLVLCKFSFPSVGLKISSLPTFALKSPIKISCGADPIRAPFPHKSYPLCHHFYPQFLHAHSGQYHPDDLLMLSMTFCFF